MKFTNLLYGFAFALMLSSVVECQAKTNQRWDQYLALRDDIFRQSGALFQNDADIPKVGIDGSYYSSICSTLNHSILKSEFPLRYSGEWVPIIRSQDPSSNLGKDGRVHIDGRRILVVKPLETKDSISISVHPATEQDKRTYRVPSDIKYTYKFLTDKDYVTYSLVPLTFEDILLYTILPGLYTYQTANPTIVGLQWAADHSEDKLYFFGINSDGFQQQHEIVGMRRSNRCQCESAARDLAYYDYTNQLFLRETNKFLLSELREFKAFIDEFEAKEKEYSKKLFSVTNALVDLMDTKGQIGRVPINSSKLTNYLGKLNTAIQWTNLALTLSDIVFDIAEATNRRDTLISMVKDQKNKLEILRNEVEKHYQNMMSECSDYYDFNNNQNIINQRYQSEVFEKIKLFVPLRSMFFSVFQAREPGGVYSADQPSIRLSN